MQYLRRLKETERKLYEGTEEDEGRGNNWENPTMTIGDRPRVCLTYKPTFDARYRNSNTPM